MNVAQSAEQAGARTRAFMLGAHVTAIAFDHAGTVGAFALGDGRLALVDGTGDPRPVAAHKGAVLSLAAHPAGGFLSGGDDGRLVHVGLDGGVGEIALFKGKWLEAIATHARAGLFAVAVGKELHLFGREGGPRVLGPHPSTVTDIDFSPDGSRIAGAHYGGVSIWTVRNPSDQPRKLAWKGSHLKLRYSPNGRFLATTTQENAIHVWRLASGADMQMAGYPAKIKSLAWSADGGLLLSSGAEPFVCWSFAGKGPEGQPPVEFGGIAGVLISVIAVHGSSPFAVAGFSDGALQLGDLEGKRATPLKAPGEAPVSALAWSGDGWHVAYGCENGEAGLIDLAPR